MHIDGRSGPTHLWKIALLLPMVPLACQDPQLERRHDLGDVSQHRAKAKVIAARKELAASGRFLYSAPPSATAATGASMAAALDIPASMIVSATYTGPEIGGEVMAGLGNDIQPRQGDSFVVLSTGSISTPPYPEPGTDIAPGGPAGDTATLRIELDVPAGASRLSFDYNFLSSESPDFKGSEFNDTFIVRVTDANGTRELPCNSTEPPCASVNVSVFHDASDSRAENSGYDIYTLDPMDVDDDFDLRLGQPDAGVTNFQSVNVAIAGGGPVTLEFDIRDLGDGILDSAVVIDNVNIQLLEVLDPNAPNSSLLTTTGQVTTDLAKLGSGGKPVVAAAADGATTLLLRMRVPSLGQVNFSLVGGTAPADGGLSAIGTSGRASTITVPAMRTAANTHYAFALFTVPEDFNRGTDGGLARRPVVFHAHFESSETGQVLDVDRNFELVRPPVVIVPGLWTGCVNWLQTPITKKQTSTTPAEAKFFIRCAEFTSRSEAALSANAKMVPNGIRGTLDEMRQNNIAVTQADIIGHGMGGLLARIYADPGRAATTDVPAYVRPDNFNRGDFNRLITVNTPHLGSVMATAIVEYRASLGDTPIVFPPEYNPVTCQPTLCSIVSNSQCKLVELECYSSPIHYGAVQDLQQLTTGVDVIDAINATNVPSHALYGIGGKNVQRKDSRFMRPALGLNSSYVWTYIEDGHPESTGKDFVFGANTPVFGAIEHDLFSHDVSQKGGIVESATKSFSSTSKGESSIFLSIKSEAYHTHIEFLLNSSLEATDPTTGGPLFATFPAPRDVPTGPTSLALAKAPVIHPQAIVPGGLAFTSPADGTPVRPGDNVLLRVEPRNGFALQRVSMIGPDGEELVLQAPFEAQYPISPEAAGVVLFHAIGRDTAGNESYSNTISLPVQLTARLQAVEIADREPILFGIGATQRLTVLGHYDDRITRNISSPVTGTIYQTSNASIVTVSPNGIITATGPGIATVIARNGMRQSSISVTVLNPNKRPVASAGADQTVTCDQPDGTAVTVTLDGSGSFDLDADTITLTWYESGAAVASGVAPTVSLSPGTHVLTLIVNDGELDSEPDTVQITVGECPPPPSSCPQPEPPVEALCTAACPCTDGLGDCDSDADCAPGLHCMRDAGLPYGYQDEEVDVCVAGCPDIGVGTSSFCTPECPCDHGQGDCDDNDDCIAGLHCMQNAGTSFGYDDPGLDVCVAGCPDVGVGTSSFCTSECPCDHGEGDCDRDADCAPGLDCTHNVGLSYGYSDPDLDVCVDPNASATSTAMSAAQR